LTFLANRERILGRDRWSDWWPAELRDELGDACPWCGGRCAT
jgi:hypothetical protein